MEIYKKGPVRFNTDRFRTFAEIYDMAEKPGYLGKEINFSAGELREKNLTFEQVKSNIVKASELMDRYLQGYLPNYYFTFKEAGEGEEAAVYFFMEEVKPTKNLPPAEWVDAFLYQCCKMYLETKKETGGFGVDLNKIDNLEFGTTSTNSNPRLYLIDLYPTYFNLAPGRLQMQISEFTKIYGGPQAFPRVSTIINKIK